MKNFKIYLACLTVVGMLFTSCSKEDDSSIGDDPANKGTLSFGAYLNDLVENKAALKQAMTDIPACSDDVPAFVDVVLTQNDAAVVGTLAEPLRVSVNPNPQDYDDDGQAEYFTDESASLELEPGTYTLEYFTVLNSDGEVIWVAPIDDGSGTGFASFVDTPLPIDIALGAGVKKYVDVEVLCFDDRDVNEYGYLFFDIEQNEAFEFCFFANFCPPSGRHFVASISVDVWIGDDDSGTLLWSDRTNVTGTNDDGDLFARPVCIALPDLSEFDDDEDYIYYEVTLLDWAGAYGDVEQLVKSGNLSRNDIIANFDGDDNVDYEHLRFGCDDTPNEDCPDDEDCDEVPNEDDKCPGYDDRLDADGDGVPDGCDVCPGHDDDVDTDGDGTPDGCDDTPGEDCPNDDDCDEVPNDEDICPGFDDKLDADGDGVPDGCDECPGYDDDMDSDNDGIADGCDECPNDPDNDCDDEEYPLDGCETAFMLGDSSFLTDDAFDFNNNRWGWAEFWDAGDSSATFEFWAAAGQNDLSNGTHVGNITIEVDGDDVEITIDMFAGNTLENAHIYLDGDVPTSNAPGQYTYQGDDLTFDLEVEDINEDGSFWIIVHGDVCGEM